MNMPDYLIEYFQEMADYMAIPRSSAMIIAMEEYRLRREECGINSVLGGKSDLNSNDQEGK